MTKRHFMRPDGSLWVCDYLMDDDEVAYAESQGYTEVQVVPLDAVVIDGPLPEVNVSKDGYYEVDGHDLGYWGQGIDDPWDYIKAVVAATLHVENRSAGSAEQVKAFADAIRDTHDETAYYSPEEMGQRLAAAGYRIEKS